jgi:ketosteroid isomerase-like protein
MMQTNVEVVRRMYDGWATGDLRAGAEDLDPHVVMVVRPAIPEFGVFVGTDGVRNYMHRLLQHWERVTFEAKHLQSVGDTVIAHVVQHSKGMASGVEGDIWFFQLFTFRGGKIVRMEVVGNRAEALEAVGLRE